MILPVLKPGKPAGEGGSYRPISLLSPCVKIKERLLLPYCNDAFGLSDDQHGFRPLRSTSTALLPIVSSVARGFNERKPPKRTAVVSADISKAFDSVNHDLLLAKVASTNLHNNIVRWLNAYLRGRSARCIYNGVKSKARIIHTGTPQGSVLSPSLWNLFVADCPHVTQPQPFYADDLYLVVSRSKVAELGPALTSALDEVSDWADKNKLELSPEKSSVTLFTPDTHETNYHPLVLLKGVPLKLDKRPGSNLIPISLLVPISKSFGGKLLVVSGF